MGIPCPPPVADTKTPKLKCPPGAIDAHFHIFGPSSQFPLSPDSYYEIPDALPETLIALHKTIGISGGVLVSGGGYGRNPAHMLHTMARFPGYFRGICVPPDDMPDDEIASMKAQGVCGVRFFTHHRGTHLAPILPKLAAKIFEHGWHVQFYARSGGLADSVDQLLALPNTIVIDHFGTLVAEQGLNQPVFQAMLRLLDTGRVWIKMSGPMRCSTMDPPYPDMTQYARALVAHAPERLVWGTDWPHPSLNDQVMPNDGDLLDLMLDWVPDEAVRNKILVDNPRKLYDFGPVP